MTHPVMAKGKYWEKLKDLTMDSRKEILKETTTLMVIRSVIWRVRC